MFNISSSLKHTLSLAALAGLACVGRADIGYSIQFVNSAIASEAAPTLMGGFQTGAPTGHIHVKMDFVAKPGATSLQAPVWAPGAYIVSNFGKSVANFAATNSKGATIAVDHPDFSTWTIASPGGKIHVEYDVPSRFAAADQVHYSGPSTYLYLIGRKLEKCNLHVELPTDWNIGIGLDPTKGDHNYSAPTYDVLADTPVTMGKFLEDEYISHGKPHYIVIYGQYADKTNRDLLKQACKYVSDAEGNFFGEVPYKRYVWHFSTINRPDGAGGLEHLNGTEISLAVGVGPGAQGVLAHEFFHLWNVKRIRSSVLGPFDYTKLPKTGALWWLEGVTDYYAHTLLHRYGWSDTGLLYRTLASNIRDTDSNDGRLKISPYDSSYKVNEASGGRGNSNGLYVSYYNTGWLLGLCLDLKIRKESHNKYGLDDVELALWKECRNNQPGFPEDEIRKLCVRFGGPALGEYYDTWVMKPGTLPTDEALASVGLKYQMQDNVVATLPMVAVASITDKGFNLSEPKAPDFVKQTITAINDQPIIGDTNAALTARLTRILATLKPGQSVKITLTNVDAQGNVTTTSTDVVLGSRSSKTGVVISTPSPTAEELELRKIWLSPRKGTQTVLPAKD